MKTVLLKMHTCSFRNGRRALPGFRSLLCALLCAALLFTALPVFAKTTAPDVKNMPETYILLADAEDPEGCIGGIEKNADSKAYPASIVKLMTALVALEHNKLSDTVTVSKHAVNLAKANTKAGIKAGEVYTLEDLLYGALLPSACDCARAIADLVAGGEEEFAVLMNAKAAELGMNNSSFANASGLHDENQYTTCRDLVRLGAACAENEEIVKILTTKDYKMVEKTTGRETKVRNINRLIRDPVPADYEKIKCIYPYCIGGKTGSTIAAGLTYLGLARRGGKTLVVVLLGDYRDTKNLSGTPYDQVIAGRFREAVDLFTYGYGLLFPETSDEELLKNGLVKTFSVTLTDTQGTKDVPASVSTVKRTAELPAEVISDPSAITGEITLEKTALPVEKGERLGYVTYTYEGETVFTLPLAADEAVSLSPEATPTPEPSLEPLETPVLFTTPVPVTGEPPKDTSAPLLLYIILALAFLLLLTLVLFLLTLRKHPRRKKH